MPSGKGTEARPDSISAASAKPGHTVTLKVALPSGFLIMLDDMTDTDQVEETYSEEETERRREAALKRMLATPHKPQEKAKKGNRKKD